MLLWLALAGSTALAGAPPQLVFPSSAELVRVIVSVTDPAGRPIRGLKSTDFTVTEDGKKRQVATAVACADFADEASPECSVDLVLLLDTSGSMRLILDNARDAAEQFIEQVPAAHARSIVAFDSRIRAMPIGDKTPAAVLDEALGKGAGGGTRLFDAIFLGLRRFSTDAARRPIMVAVTDGEDTSDKPMGGGRRGGRYGGLAALSSRRDDAPHRSLKDTARALQLAGVTFYGISFARRVGNGQATLQSMATATGGLIVDGEATDLKGQFNRIREDAATQYVLGFVPGASAVGKTHNLKVTVASAGSTVRHRLMYETRSRH
ncbi:MAG: VWA domain-containing protein [Vicinamibacteria bacterium]